MRCPKMVINDPGSSGSDKAFEVFVKPLTNLFLCEGVCVGCWRTLQGEIHTCPKNLDLVFIGLDKAIS